MKPPIRAAPGANVVIGGKRARIEPDGSLGSFTQSPEQKKKRERRAANKRARASRRANR